MQLFSNPYYIDQSQAGTATTPWLNDQGDFHFLIPCRSYVPELTWVVQLVPMPNGSGNVITRSRDFAVQQMNASGGSAVSVSLVPSGTSYSNYSYNSTTGVETLSFTTAAYDDSQRQVASCTLKIGIGIIVGSGTSAWYNTACSSDTRHDKLIVQAYYNGQLLFTYDTYQMASPDKRDGVCVAFHDDAQDGRI